MKSFSTMKVHKGEKNNAKIKTHKIHIIVLIIIRKKKKDTNLQNTLKKSHCFSKVINSSIPLTQKRKKQFEIQ